MLSPSLVTLLGSTLKTAHNDRVTSFLRNAELSPPSRIPRLEEPRASDSEPSLLRDSDEARCLLVQQRTSEPGYRQPEQKARRIFWTAKRKELNCNQDTWIFTKHEVAKAFDGLVSRTPLGSPGVAQALLSHVSQTSLNELWCHLHDPKLEKKAKNLAGKSRLSLTPETQVERSASFFRGSRLSLTPKTPWLDHVTNQDGLEFIRLICRTGLDQEALDRAFSIALSKHSMNAMEVLFRFGAIASACQDAIRERVRLDDVALVRLLLSAPGSMSVEAWRYCIEPECDSLEASGKQVPTILLLCLTHRPEVSCGLLLIKALQSQNFKATVIILAYARVDKDFRSVQQLACELASHFLNNEDRHTLFEMLAVSGLVADNLLLREELLKAVSGRHLRLIQVLADAGVSLDSKPHNVARWAVSQMDLDILELFKNGNFSSPVSLALKSVPDAASESDMLRLLGIFAPRGLANEFLDSHLIRAVRKQQIQLVDMLLRHGASVEFEQASAIQRALEMADFDTLRILLRKKCSPEILSPTVITAMALQPRPSRLQAMKALLEKGVLMQDLSVPLQTLVLEKGSVDTELVQLLLQHKAPVDITDDDVRNPVLASARRGDVAVLKMLCDAQPRNETLSKAIPIAFDVIRTSGYEAALIMIKLLLQKGATGMPVHQTLLTATRQDHRLEVVRLLIENGADANYATGASFIAALEISNFKLLEILCVGCRPGRASMEDLLSMAIDPRL